MRKTLLVVVLLVGAASSQPERPESWEEFKRKHGKVYRDPTEENHRMKTFAANKVRVAQHMKEFAAGKHTFTVALNQFADLTAEEFVRDYTGLKMETSAPETTGTTQTAHKTSGKKGPDAVDWRDSGLVTSVKHQGRCGSCYAFSANGALEAAWAKAGHGLHDLSAQQLVDCSSTYGNLGCSGGWMHKAYDYIKANGGVDSESAYPYTYRFTSTIADDSCQAGGENVATLASYVRIPSRDEAALQDAVASAGPVAVGMYVSGSSFMLYSGGVYSEPLCRSDVVNHAVLVVGYGKEKGRDYWLVKNTYGADWGDGGYIKMARNDDNHCAIATYAYYPVV